MDDDLKAVGTLVAQYAGNAEFDAWQRILSALRQRDEALARQTDNMAFVLNRVDLGTWHDKLDRELAEDRAILTGSETNAR